MRPHDANNQRVKVFHEFARSRLIVLTHAVETASQIERLVVSHIVKEMEARSATTCKTGLSLRGYGARGFLDTATGG